MGMGWEMSGNSSAAAVAAVVVAAAPSKSWCFLVNIFYTIRSQNRDLGATPPGNYSCGRRASFWFSPKSGKPMRNHQKNNFRLNKSKKMQVFAQQFIPKNVFNVHILRLRPCRRPH